MKNNIIGGSLPLKCLDMVMNLDFSQHWRAPFLDLLELTVWKKNDLLYTFQSIFLWTIKIFIERSKSVRNSLEVEKKGDYCLFGTKVIWSNRIFTKPQKMHFELALIIRQLTRSIYFSTFFCTLSWWCKKEMTSSNYYFFNKKLKLPVYTI